MANHSIPAPDPAELLENHPVFAEARDMAARLNSAVFSSVVEAAEACEVAVDRLDEMAARLLHNTVELVSPQMYEILYGFNPRVGTPTIDARLKSEIPGVELSARGIFTGFTSLTPSLNPDGANPMDGPFGTILCMQAVKGDRVIPQAQIGDAHFSPVEGCKIFFDQDRLAKDTFQLFESLAALGNTDAVEVAEALYARHLGKEVLDPLHLATTAREVRDLIDRLEGSEHSGRIANIFLELINLRLGFSSHSEFIISAREVWLLGKTEADHRLGDLKEHEVTVEGVGFGLTKFKPGVNKFTTDGRTLSLLVPMELDGGNTVVAQVPLENIDLLASTG